MSEFHEHSFKATMRSLTPSNIVRSAIIPSGHTIGVRKLLNGDVSSSKVDIYLFIAGTKESINGYI